MLARNLSLASAMTLVGLGLFANAGVNLATSGQGRAFAEESKRRAVPASAPNQRVPPVFEEGRMRGVDGGADAMAAGAGDGCVVEGEPLDWFGEVRVLPECALETDLWGFIRWRIPLAGDTGDGYQILFDVNLDARPEGVLIRDGLLFEGGVPLPAKTILVFSRTMLVDGQLVIVEQPLLRSDPFIAIVVSQGKSVGEVFVGGWGWSDLDADGDFDLLVKLWTDGAVLPLWVENTGFVPTQPLTGDLNHDGSVNAADLTMLLGGWTGN